MSVKLYNKGQRAITTAGGNFMPGSTGAFTPEAAAKLKRLYPHELVSLEDEVKRFDAPAQPLVDVTEPEPEIKASKAEGKASKKHA